MKLKQHIEKLLDKNPKFCDDKGLFNVDKVLKNIEEFDQELCKILLDDDTTKKLFFTKVDNIDILEQNKLINLFLKQTTMLDRYDVLQEKLVIKKDNLIMLHNKKSLYAKKIKLIYIDPLYDRYRNDFTHLSWLIFMKSYLEIAKEFLSDDGMIFVQIDDDEQVYLNLLIDMIFCKKEYISKIIWEKKVKNLDEKKRICIALMYS